MKGAYTNTQILDRLFNQNVQNQQQPSKGKRQGAKGSSAIAIGKASGQMQNVPSTSDFMPSSATSATAFYAAQKQAQAAQQSNSQMFSNY